MPEPRQIALGGETYIRCEDGHSEGYSEYGHRPWQKGFQDEKRAAVEAAALRRFETEWAVMQGPAFRGTPWEMYNKNNGPFVTSEELHKWDLEQAKKYRHLK